MKRWTGALGAALPWLAAGATCALGLGLMMQCAAIHAAGTGFSRELALQRLGALTPLAAVWLLAVSAAALVWRPKKAVFRMEAENALRLLRPRVEETVQMQGEQRKRRRAHLLAGAVMALCWGMAAVYLLNPMHFVSWDLEMVLGDMLKVIALPGVLSLAAAIGCEYYVGRSCEAEWMLARKAPRRTEPPETKTARTGHALIWRAALYVLAAALAAWGIANGGMYDVLVKAINICTECIGLG